MFHSADPRDILNGSITDVYFERTLAILKAKGINPVVKAEFIAKNLPDAWGWAVFAGLEEAMSLMKHLSVNVRAMREGTVFYPYEPVMEIEGRYQDFCVYETALLGLICQASGVATKAARVKKLAGDRLVMSFGARRMHPILAPMIERNAYIGGCDGVAVGKSAELIEAAPMGTMPHALIIVMGDTLEATRAFDDVIEPAVRRTALIDTFNDEKFEAIHVAQEMGERLFAIRLDTPASRRGNFYRILEEVRWELDLRGLRHVKLFVSGGIKEDDIPGLNPVVDAYGIGTSISNAPVVDFAMDIVEVEGRPLAKRGKWSGSKSVLRCKLCGSDVIGPFTEKPGRCACGGELTDLLYPLTAGGGVTRARVAPGEIREKVLRSVSGLKPVIGKP